MSKTEKPAAQLQTDADTGIVLASAVHADAVDARKDGLLDGMAIDQAQASLKVFEERIDHLSSMSDVFDDDGDSDEISMGGQLQTGASNEAPAADPVSGDDAGQEEDVVIGGLTGSDEDDGILLGEVFQNDGDLMAPFADDEVSGAQDESLAAAAEDQLPDDFTAPDDAELARIQEASDAARAEADEFSSEDLSFLQDGLEDPETGNTLDEADDEEEIGPDPREQLISGIAAVEDGAEEVQSLSSLIGGRSLPGADEPGAEETGSDHELQDDLLDDLDWSNDAADLTEGEAGLDTPEDTEIAGAEDAGVSFDEMPRPGWTSADDVFSIPGSAHGAEELGGDLSSLSAGEVDGDDPETSGELDAAEDAKTVDFSDVTVFNVPEEGETPSYTAEACDYDYRNGYGDDASDDAALLSELEEGVSGVSDDAKNDTGAQEASGSAGDSWLDTGTAETDTPQELPADNSGDAAEEPSAQPEGKRKRSYLLPAAVLAALAVGIPGTAYFLNGKQTGTTTPVQVAQQPAEAGELHIANEPAPGLPQAVSPGETLDLTPSLQDPAKEPGTTGVSEVDVQVSDPAAPEDASPAVEASEAESTDDAETGADVGNDEAGQDASDLSDLFLQDIPVPAAIDGDTAPADASAQDVTSLADDLESAAQGDLDRLFLDEPAPEPETVQPAVTEADLAGFAKQDDIAELREAIDLMFENMKVMSDEVVERDRVIVGLQEQLAQAELKAQRAETLALGQNEVLAEFLRVKDKLDMAENLIVDLSRRIAAVETNDPADRVAVERSIGDLNDRLESLARDLGLIARVAINGSPAKAQSAGQQRPPEFPGADSVYTGAHGDFEVPGFKAQIPADVKVGDFVEGYGYVLQIMPTAEGGRVVVMENKSVLIP